MYPNNSLPAATGRRHGEAPPPVPVKVKVERDLQAVTIEGFRTLGIVSTFIASAEAQCLGLVSDIPDHPKISEAATALLLVGLLLSSFGAALSLLSARWFEVLTDDQVELLEERLMEARRKGARSSMPLDAQELDSAQDIKVEEPYADIIPTWKDRLVAKALGTALVLVFCGFYTFVVGMVLYAWIARSMATAIVNTVAAAFGTSLLVFMHLDFNGIGVLKSMSFKRPRL
ncbi:unnamed protein product [Rhizoctonia solani]|nr:unnamed protein product [Rhizoctonia solani]